MTVDFWAWRYHEDPRAAEEIVDDEFDAEAEVARLNDEADGDVSKVDDWESL